MVRERTKVQHQTDPPRHKLTLHHFPCIDVCLPIAQALAA
jgi:hypothetical protein